MNIGIYKITNIINNKIYIGSSVNIKRRKKYHLAELKNNKHGNIHLQRAFNKYGENVFKFDTIEYCTKDNLRKKEQCYINKLNPEYNILKIVGSSYGRTINEELRQKLRDNMINNKYALGYKHTEETKEKLSISHLGMQNSLGHKHTKMTLDKMRNAKLGKKQSLAHKEKRAKSQQKSIVQLTKDRKFIKEFISNKIAGEELNLSNGNISNYCKYEAGLSSHNRTTGGYRFMYKEQYIENFRRI